MSKIGLGISFYAGCPEGKPCLKLGLVFFFFFLKVLPGARFTKPSKVKAYPMCCSEQ